jgi:hypothetical protein
MVVCFSCFEAAQEAKENAASRRPPVASEAVLPEAPVEGAVAPPAGGEGFGAYGRGPAGWGKFYNFLTHKSYLSSKIPL